MRPAGADHLRAAASELGAGPCGPWYPLLTRLVQTISLLVQAIRRSDRRHPEPSTPLAEKVIV
jgi:hypothetical protein